MPVRKKEEQRVLKENHKILLRVGNTQPTAELSRTQLKKRFENHQNLKKLISTKYLHRDERKIRVALLKSKGIKDNLPPLHTVFGVGASRNRSGLTTNAGGFLGSETSIQQERTSGTSLHRRHGSVALGQNPLTL